MTARALIAHGGPQRLPTRAAPSLVRALRDARGSPPWTPWTILCRLDRQHPFYATCTRVDGAHQRIIAQRKEIFCESIGGMLLCADEHL